MKLILLPNNSKQEAEKIVRHFESSGSDVVINNLEVLDEILHIITPKLRRSLKIHSGNKVLDIKMVERLRFERGLDIRPEK